MKKASVRSYAKINLSLDVLNKLPNGYHEVKMVMQSVSLYDSVSVELTDKDIEITTNLPFLSVGKDNLVHKAASLFFEESNISGGVKIDLHKRIPVGAGLAGGSSNAAAVLKVMNNLYGTNFSLYKLCSIGAKLGADVPYCILGGTRLAEGIGDRLSPLPSIPKCHIVLVKPPFSISTKWVYENIDQYTNSKHPDTDALIRGLESNDLNAICSNLGNMLEDVSISSYPILESLKKQLIDLGALGAQMSGSGPTIFAIFDDFKKAQKAKMVLKSKYKAVFLCNPV